MCLTLFGIMLNSAFYRDDTCPCCLFYFTLAIHSRKFRMAFVRGETKENCQRFLAVTKLGEHLSVLFPF